MINRKGLNASLCSLERVVRPAPTERWGTWTDVDSGGGMRALPPERDERRNRLARTSDVQAERTGTDVPWEEREHACRSLTETERLRA